MLPLVVLIACVARRSELVEAAAEAVLFEQFVIPPLRHIIQGRLGPAGCAKRRPICGGGVVFLSMIPYEPLEQLLQLPSDFLQVHRALE